MLIEELTSREFEELSKKVKTLIIPVGSIEAHGPHLPLATDLYTIYEICKKLSKEIEVFVAPPIYYGLCRSTKHLFGTVSVSGEILKALILNLLSEFYRHGFRIFFILSGHAGKTHLAYLIDAAETFVEKFKDTKFFVADIYQLLKEFLSEIKISEKDSHAGEWETSLIMYLKPELIKKEGFEDYPHFPKFRIVSEKEKYWSSGIWGNPHKASTEKGKEMVEYLLKILKGEIQKIEKED